MRKSVLDESKKINVLTISKNFKVGMEFIFTSSPALVNWWSYAIIVAAAAKTDGRCCIKLVTAVIKEDINHLDHDHRSKRINNVRIN